MPAASGGDGRSTMTDKPHLSHLPRQACTLQLRLLVDVVEEVP